jgi:hypothetical protein
MGVTKTAMTGLSLATLLLFGGGIFLYLNLSSIAKPIIEKIASDTMGVPVRMSGLDISLENKTATISGLTIGNPAGYSKPHAVESRNITVSMESISKELIVFNAITIANTDVFLEVKSDSTNLTDLKKRISPKRALDNAKKRVQDKLKLSEDTSEKEVTAKTKKADLKVIIKTFTMAGAALQPSVVLFDAQDLGAVPVPDTVINGIGGQNGIPVRDAVAQISKAVLDKFSTTSARAGLLKGVSVDALEDLGLSQIEAVSERVQGGIEELGNEIGNKIRGIFGD